MADVQGLKNKVMAMIDARQDEQMALTAKLVSFPTTFGNEEAAQNYFAGVLKEMSAEVEIFEPDIEELRKHPAFVSPRENFNGSPVVAGVFKGTGGGRSMVLCGHMDVVNPGDAPWTDSPWEFKIKDGKAYGRGVLDMKGGIAANTMAVKCIQECGIKLKGDVKILTTIDEECGSSGILALIQKGYTGDAAIFTEPTDKKVNVASGGSFWYTIKVKGIAAHGAVSYNGVNALYKAIPLVQRIQQLEEDRRMRLYGSVPVYDRYPIPFCAGVNMLNAGTWPAIVPPEASFQGRIGVSPLEDVDDVKKEFEDAIYSVAKADPWLRDHMPEIEYHKSRWNSGCIAEDHPFTQTLKANWEAVLGEPQQVEGMFACSDSGTMNHYGNTPSIDCGPGPTSLAHQTDEYAYVEDLVQTAKAIACTLIDWCGVQD